MRITWSDTTWVWDPIDPRRPGCSIGPRRQSGVVAMPEVAGRRMTAESDGDFVVFLIGARPSKLHLARSLMDLGGRRGMKHMLDYLVAHPEKGLLAYEM